MSTTPRRVSRDQPAFAPGYPFKNLHNAEGGHDIAMARRSSNLRFYKLDGDWLNDPDLVTCSSAARGFLVDLLCRMQYAGADSLSDTEAGFALLGRCRE